jgi:hypothetical protein
MFQAVAYTCQMRSHVQKGSCMVNADTSRYTAASSDVLFVRYDAGVVG